MGRAHKLKERIKATYTEWKDDDAQTWAASVAFYTIFSLAPLLILAVAIAGFAVGQEAARGELADQMQATLGEAGAEVFQSTVANAGGASGVIATIVSAFLLFLGASKVFAELQTALNRIWDVRTDPDQGWRGAVRKRLTGFAMVLGVGVFLLAAVGLSVLLSGVEQFLGGAAVGSWFWEAINFLGSFALIGVVFALLFKFVPDVDIQWSDVWFGAFVTAVLFVLGKLALGVYFAHASFGSTYGAASSLVILLAWIYYSAQIFFFGAEYTQVHARRQGHGIEPDEHAVRESDTLEMPGGARPSAS